MGDPPVSVASFLLSRRASRTVFATGLIGLAGSVAACGSGNGVADLPADQILSKAKKAAASSQSLHVTGSAKQDGKKIHLDVTYVKGSGAKGSFSQGGKKVQFVKLADKLYVKGAGQFVPPGAPAAAKQLLRGKYIKVGARNEGFDQFETFGNKKKFLKEFLSPDGELTKVKGSEIRGKSTVGIKTGGEDGGGTLYISTEGEPYPLRLASNDSKGQFDLAQYGSDLSVKAPQQSKVVDLKKLKRTVSGAG